MARDFTFADVLSDGPVYTDSRGRSRFRSSSFDPAGGPRQQQMGFTRGFSLGEEAGWKDGYNLGLQRGAQLASELGFYQGFVHAWITVLEREETVKQRKLTALKTLLDMTRSFPRGSMFDDDIMEKLQKIRAKFKQVVALLNVSTEYAAPEEPVNQRTEMSF